MMMAELHQYDSSISAPRSFMPFTLTSSDDPLQTNEVKLLTTPSPETNADLALPNHPRGAANKEKVDDNFQSSESRETLVQNEQDINSSTMLVMGDGTKISCEDLPVIKYGQASSIALHKEWDQLALLHCSRAPIKQLIWADGGCNMPAQLQEKCEAEEQEEECVTPTAKEQRIPHEILVCPPPPCKKRRTLSLPDCKVRKRLSYPMPPPSSSSSSTPEYLHLQRHAAGCQVVVNPPDLHTFPACIRALFLHH